MHSVHHMQKKKKKAEKYVPTAVQVCTSFFPKVIPPAAKLARLFYYPVVLKPSLFNQTHKLIGENMEFKSSDSLSKACRNSSWSA